MMDAHYFHQIDIGRLKAARDLLAAPGGWTTGILARDKNGTPVDCDSTEATCFCTSGAMIKERVHSAIFNMFGNYVGGIPVWNDHPGRTQADVVLTIDQFIGDLSNGKVLHSH